MNVVTAFAAVGLTAVSWDDTLSRAGARAFRHALDYREPYCRMSENEVVLLMDAVLAMRLEKGTKSLMLEAAKALTADQSLTAYAMASELMRSDGPYSAEERRRLDLLALMLSISQLEAERIDSVFELLHAPWSQPFWSTTRLRPHACHHRTRCPGGCRANEPRHVRSAGGSCGHGGALRPPEAAVAA